jgi:uncharacterized membrane protein (UPF0127 family)
MRFDRLAIARTRRGDLRLRLAVADGPGSRLCGLMFRAPMKPGPDTIPGLLLTGCTAVHGSFLREALDLAFLSERGCVVATARLRRWGVVWAPAARGGAPARHTLELPRGSLARLGLLAGDWILPGEVAPVAAAGAADPFAADALPGVSRWARAAATPACAGTPAAEPAAPRGGR